MTSQDHTNASGYCIKSGYQPRTSNQTLERKPGDYWNRRRLRTARYAQRQVYEAAVRLALTQRLRTAIDVGCGVGIKMMQLLAPVARCTGVDQPTAVEQARRLYPHGHFVADDFEKPQHGDLGTFDLVICADVIEHLLDPDVLLRYLRARCHDDSWLVISTPERDRCRGLDNMAPPKREHVREWNQREFARYLRSRGLRIERHLILPAYRPGRSLHLWRDRLRMLYKRIPLRHVQMAVCRPAAADSLPGGA